MQTDLNKLRQHLEALTAESCPADATRDEESAGLRAAWLAFGKLLEEHRAELDGSAALSEVRQMSWRLGRPCLGPAGDADLSGTRRATCRPIPTGRHPSGRRWLLTAASVAAACVVLAVAIGRHVRTAKPAAAPTPEQVVAKASPSRAGPCQANRTATASRTGQWDWDDSEDQAIDQLGQATIQVEQDELASTAGSSSIVNELDAIQKVANGHNTPF